jgi:diacylglycerol O-acyltransferase / wax synthase
MTVPPNRMSDAEGLMWRLDKDPFLASTFGNVTILDRTIDVERFRRRMTRAAMVVPRLRQRVLPAPANVSLPLWVDDPEFDIDRHVRHIALPKPASMRQLEDLAILIVADPFDRSHPLWEFTVVDGLRNGRCALIQKIHHAVTDGEGGIKISMQFLDLERDAPEPPPLAEPVGGASSVPASENVLTSMVQGAFRGPLTLVRQLRDLVAEPTRIPAAGQATVAAARAVLTQITDTEKAHSPLWTSRSLGRHIEFLRTPIDPMKAAAKRLDGTLNAAFVTAAADAAGAYHRELGSPVGTLRTSMAISTRSKGDKSAGNAFSLARIVVPTGDMPIAERFHKISNLAASARASASSGTLNQLAALAATLPDSVVTRMARAQGETVDFATSNVRAAPFAVYVSGAQVMENYPVGPLGGVAFNLTLMSYSGSLDMGLTTDTAAVKDAELLRRLLVDALKRLARSR